MSTRERPLRLAVVGHTNTGKTSLLRTLLRNPDFGQVADQPGTTRHVEGANLLIDGDVAVQLFDTPGLEDSIALLDYLDVLAPPAQRLDGPDRIRRFLDSPESSRRFEQEARVLRQLLDCDAGLYVVDVRDPVLGKHKDELALLAACGHPLLPVLNFSREPTQRLTDWRTALARLGLHAMVEFDTVAPAIDGELQLYDKLAVLLDTHASLLQALNQNIAEQRAQRRRDALRLIAELLIDASAYRVSCPPDDASVRETTQRFRNTLRERENRCVQAVLKRYNFRRTDVSATALPLDGQRWHMDLFHPQALKDMGIHLGKGIAAGAMAGATLDAFTAGISLGTATLLGAAAGGLWQGADKLGKRVMGRLRGYRELTLDDAVIRLLALRELALVHALEARGHAAQSPVDLNPFLDRKTRTGWEKDRLPDPVLEARSQPQWSSLNADHTNSARRQAAVDALANVLAHSLGGSGAVPAGQT
jgi:GTPase SAR1 family protein